MVQQRKQTTNEPRERMMISEYIVKYLGGQRWTANYKLGRAINPGLAQNLTDSQIRALGVRKAFADLIVEHQDRLDIYEFQIVPRWSKFGQLLGYLELVKETDTLAYYHNLPNRGIMVNAVDDPVLKRLCEKYGLLYQVYSPEWLPMYWETLRPRDYTPIQVNPP